MNILLKKKFKNLIIFTLFAMLILCFAFLHFNGTEVFGATRQDFNMFLPETSVEYKELVKPVDVYSDEHITAIAEAGTVKELIVNYNGEYFNSITDLTAIKQVKKLNDTCLLISDNGIIFKVQISESTKTLTKTELRDGQSTIGCNFFDINNNYLVTAFGTTGVIYTRNNDLFTKSNAFGTFTVKQDKPLTINDKYIFFINDEGLCRYDIAAKSDALFIKNISPEKMIADNQFVYYIENNQIYRIDMQGHQAELKCSDTYADYDLGNISSPINVSFKGENLLVIESNTIQEFEIIDDTLHFTGFAVAKGKTAYNRVNGSSQNAQIQKYNNTVAVLDNDKLTVVLANTEDLYQPKNFKNFLLGQDNELGTNLSAFALGEDSVLLAYDINKETFSLKMIDLTHDTDYLTEISFTTSATIKDVYYHAGSYYLLTTDSTNKSMVYKFDKSTTEITDQNVLINLNDFSANTLAVDLNQNVYLANNNQILRLLKSDEYKNLQPSANKCAISNVSKMQIDLGGRIFALAGGQINRINNITATPIPVTDSLMKIKSFALDFTNDNAYVLVQDQEYALTTTALDNLSITDLVIPNEYKLTNDSTKVAPETLKSYTIAQGENAIIVNNVEGAFTYSGLAKELEQFIYVCPIKDSQDKITLHILIGQEKIGIALSNKNCTEINKSTDVPTKVYSATSVNGYFYPIITRHSDYVLTNEQTKIRLDKGVEITPQFAISFLDQTYYYASFVYNGVTFKGYIPDTYTVELLDKDFAYDNYSIEKVKQTELITASGLVIPLQDQTSVRIIENQGDICVVAVYIDGQWVEGVIKTQSIINNPAIAIRNVIIIVAISTCLFATALFFILRKKKN